MYNEDELSGGYNNLVGPYQFLNQAAVSNAVASGQNIDWAQLAQQWIQMRDSTSTTIGVTNFPPSNSGALFEQCPAAYDEKGEADMDMDDEEHVDDRAIVDRNKRNSLTTVMQQQLYNTNRQWSGDKSMFANSDLSSDVHSHKTNQWSNTQVMLTTNCNVQGANRQTNPTAHIPSLLSMHVPHPNELRALPENSSELSGQQTVMDAAKRKALPAWIREGLEKMEREKQKQQEKFSPIEDELEVSDNDSSGQSKIATVNSLNLAQTDDEDTLEAQLTENYPQLVAKTDALKEELVYKTYEQKLSEMMVVVRRTLTELLLEVTNEEISKIANESFKSFKLKASSAQVIHKSALSSITSKLGLAAYDDSSSDEGSDGNEIDNSLVNKNVTSESGNDSEDEIKNSVRSKRRAFAKIASEIEERVAAAAVKEEEKLKYFSTKDEAFAYTLKNKSVETSSSSQQREADSRDTYQVVASCSGKLFERDTGETTETKLQTLNGKQQKERGVGGRRERTTRFSDIKEKKYVTLATSASYIRDIYTKDPVNAPTVNSQSLPVVGQTSYKTTTLQSNAVPTAETFSKQKAGASSEKITVRGRNHDKKETHSKTEGRRTSRDSSSGSQHSTSSSSSSSSSSQSSSSNLDSSTSNSSNNSRHSCVSRRKHSSSHVSSSDKAKSSSQSQRDKYDDRKHHTSNNDRARETNRSRYRSRSRSHHRRKRRDSHDSDKYYSRRTHSYTSSHSRSRNSNHHRHDYSTSNSRSSYSSSSNRRN